jgi:hypothetical protein
LRSNGEEVFLLSSPIGAVISQEKNGGREAGRLTYLGEPWK